MKDNDDQLLNHVEETNKLLLADKKQHPNEPFFSKETTEQLQTHYKTARPIVQVPKLSQLTML